MPPSSSVGLRLALGAYGSRVCGKCLCRISPDSRQMSRRDMTWPVPDPRQMSRRDMTFGHRVKISPRALHARGLKWWETRVARVTLAATSSPFSARFRHLNAIFSSLKQRGTSCPFASVRRTPNKKKRSSCERDRCALGHGRWIRPLVSPKFGRKGTPDPKVFSGAMSCRVISHRGRQMSRHVFDITSPEIQANV